MAWTTKPSLHAIADFNSSLVQSLLLPPGSVTLGRLSLPVSLGRLSLPVSLGRLSLPVTLGSLSLPVSLGRLSLPVTLGSLSLPVSLGRLSLPVSLTGSSLRGISFVGVILGIITRVDRPVKRSI